MRHSVVEMTRAVRRRLKRVVRKREKDYGRPAFAVLHLWETQGSVAEVAHRVRAARSSVYRWQSLYETYGEDAFTRKLGDGATGRRLRKCCRYWRHREGGPAAVGLSALGMEFATAGHRVGEPKRCRGSCDNNRWLARLQYRYRRASPTTLRRDPRKAEPLAAIEAALAKNDPYAEVFYVDEADMELNPRIGSS